MKLAVLTAAIAVAASGAWAEGDAAAGEKVFKKCQACHSIIDADGNKIAGMGKTGPNLWGVVGRAAGTEEGFKYRESIVEAGQKGLVWNEEEIATYVMDPSKFLEDYLSEPAARSGMSFKLRKESEGENVAAYLAQFGPAAN